MFGISDHDLMFSRDAKVEEKLEDEGTDYIAARVSILMMPVTGRLGHIASLELLLGLLAWASVH